MKKSTTQGILLDEQMLSYDFGSGHVMNTERILAAYELLKEIFLQSTEFTSLQARAYDRKYLLQAHDLDYIEMLEELSEFGTGKAPKFGLGTPDTPIWKGMAEVSNFVVQSTVSIAEDVYGGKVDIGFGLLGGLHHATHRKAAGFCYYNDINVAIHRLKSLDPDIRIIYIDTDLHHGDGVQQVFYRDPNVLTISLHESGEYLFPGTGFPHEIGEGRGMGSSVNVPFYPYTWDKPYRHTFDQIFPVLFETFGPDYVIWQAGGDAHIHDPLGHMMLTSSTYRHLGEQIRSAAITNMDHPKIMALGGGGYNAYGNAKSWTNALAGLTESDLPKEASQEWLRICEDHGISVQRPLEEPPSEAIEMERRSIEEANSMYYHQLQEVLSDFYTI